MLICHKKITSYFHEWSLKKPFRRNKISHHVGPCYDKDGVFLLTSPNKLLWRVFRLLLKFLNQRGREASYAEDGSVGCFYQVFCPGFFTLGAFPVVLQLKFAGADFAEGVSTTWQGEARLQQGEAVLAFKTVRRQGRGHFYFVSLQVNIMINEKNSRHLFTIDRIIISVYLKCSMRLPCAYHIHIFMYFHSCFSSF